MAGAGFTPAAIDAMPMDDVLALLRYWRDHPPAHEILAAAYGIRPAPASNPDDPSNIGALIARFPGGNMER
jgi:hypothetical protein